MTDMRNFEIDCQEDNASDCLAVLKAFAIVAAFIVCLVALWITLPGAKSVDDVLQIKHQTLEARR